MEFSTTEECYLYEEPSSRTDKSDLLNCANSTKISIGESAIVVFTGKFATKWLKSDQRETIGYTN